MEAPEHDFGQLLSVDAEAVGKPGQRRFRLLARTTTQSAAIWMEKQQLAGIGIWFREVAERLDRDQPTTEADVEPMPFPKAFAVEFRASQVGLGYSEGEGLFEIVAFRGESGANQMPSFRCQLSRGQSRVLSRKIEAIVASGRPICPLCEMPIDPDGHVCPRSNGHKPAVV